MTVRNHSYGPLMGFFEYDAERVDRILRQADDISVRDKLEQVNNSNCYVIEAKTNRGNYTLWIDPEHGYNIAKAQNTKQAGDLTFSYDYLLTDKAKISHFVENVRFEKIDGVWIPTEADMGSSRIYYDGRFLIASKMHVKATDIILNPDHDALGSFLPDDIKNGAKARIKGVPAITYTWQNGELIPQLDKYIVDALDNMTDEIMAEKAGSDTSVPSKSKIELAKLTVSELLDKYRATQDKLKSFIATGESAIEKDSRKTKTNSTFCFDGDRVRYRGSSWNDILGREKGRYESFLWDGKSFIQYSGASGSNDGSVSVRENDRLKDIMVSTIYRGAPLMGFYAGDTKRIDSIISKAGTAKLRDKAERIGKSQCYVIDASTKQGKYTLWIDPGHGYNIARAEVEGQGKRQGTSFLLENLRFESISGVWAPMEADVRETATAKGKDRVTKWNHKRTEMVLGPDFASLKSFVADDIPDGTEANLFGSRDKYKWQNGKMVGR